MTPTRRTLTETTDLGSALLIAEFEGASYEPISAVSTLREAREMAEDDLRRRMERVEAGEEPGCPAGYKVWVRNGTGGYEVASEIAASVN